MRNSERNQEDGKNIKFLPTLRDSLNTLLQQENNHAVSPLPPKKDFENVSWQHKMKRNKSKRRPVIISRCLHSSRRLRTRRMHYNVLLSNSILHISSTVVIRTPFLLSQLEFLCRTFLSLWFVAALLFSGADPESSSSLISSGFLLFS